MTLQEVMANESLLEIGRKAIEDAVIEMRDNRISMPFRGNGVVCREKDGSPSSVIRVGTDAALKIGLEAICKYLENSNADITGDTTKSP